MMVERYPNLKEEVGGSILDCEISRLLDKKLTRWSTASCALALTCRPSKKFKKRKEKKEKEEDCQASYQRADVHSHTE